MKINRFKNVAIFSTLFVSCFGSASLSSAATFNVNNGSELQTALSDAQNNDEDDIINLAPGNYDAGGGTFIYLADNTGGSEENFSLTLNGSGLGQTVLDGGDANQVMTLTTDNGLTDSSGADIQVSDMTFQNGNATESGGGLLIVTDQGDATVQRCEFLNNHTDNFAGGMDIQTGSGNILLNASNIIGNDSSQEISGVELFTTSGVIVATNNIIFDNHSFDGGGFGALFVSFSGGGGSGKNIDVINNTITGNSATEPEPSGAVGGGLFVDLLNPSESANVFNNIIFGNSTNNADDQGGEDIFLLNDGFAGSIEFFNNDFSQTCFSDDLGVSVTCDLTGITNLNAGGNLLLDPLLVDPAGGNFNLAANSPVINQGDSAAPSLPATDHDGNPRISGGQVDMGALEFQVVPTPTPTPEPSGGCALRR
jgi:hypothetical protein